MEAFGHQGIHFLPFLKGVTLKGPMDSEFLPCRPCFNRSPPLNWKNMTDQDFLVLQGEHLRERLKGGIWSEQLYFCRFPGFLFRGLVSIEVCPPFLYGLFIPWLCIWKQRLNKRLPLLLCLLLYRFPLVKTGFRQGNLSLWEEFKQEVNWNDDISSKDSGEEIFQRVSFIK